MNDGELIKKSFLLKTQKSKQRVKIKLIITSNIY